jgi:outer membrane protein OmpA-like peptidoglycan-associated protein
VLHFTIELGVSQAALTDIHWDGRDENGQWVSSKEAYTYQWELKGQTSAAYALLQVNPVLKLCFADGTTLEPQALFEFQTRPQLQSWTLALVDNQSGLEIRTQPETAVLPENWIWDGRASDQTLAPTQNQYMYCVDMVYPQGQEVVVTEAVHAIKARRSSAPGGQTGLIIPEIWFDFNSAVLKPDMLDKITAAAQVLQRHPGQAVAVCEGHADEIGSHEYNQKISVQRAYMVAKFLAESLHIPSSTLFVRGFGKIRPEVPQNTEEARARNRRVEIRVLINQP